VLCAVTILSSADLLSLNIYMVCGCMCISSICVCVCVLLSVEDLFVNSSQTDLPLTRAQSTHTN